VIRQSAALRRSVPATLRAAGRIGLLILVSTLVVACGSAAVTPGPSTPASPRPSTSAIVPPSSVPETPEPSVDAHGAQDLEALLPSRVGGVALERRSLTGPDFHSLGTPETQERLDAMLATMNKNVTDLTVADAYDPRALTILEVGAFRVAGAEPAQLLSEWVASNQASNPGRISVTNETIDGRALTKLVDSTREVGGTTRAFVIGDTIFLVGADDQALVSDALAQLPKP
jgi:hypothetical protein